MSHPVFILWINKSTYVQFVDLLFRALKKKNMKGVSGLFERLMSISLNDPLQSISSLRLEL